MLLTQKQHECANQRKHAYADSEAVRISTLWWTNMMPNAAGSMMEIAIRKMTIPGMGPHPVARIQCHARRKLVSGRSEKGC